MIVGERGSACWGAGRLTCTRACRRRRRRDRRHRSTLERNRNACGAVVAASVGIVCVSVVTDFETFGDTVTACAMKVWIQVGTGIFIDNEDVERTSRVDANGIVAACWKEGDVGGIFEPSERVPVGCILSASLCRSEELAWEAVGETSGKLVAALEASGGICVAISEIVHVHLSWKCVMENVINRCIYDRGATWNVNEIDAVEVHACDIGTRCERHLEYLDAAACSDRRDGTLKIRGFGRKRNRYAILYNLFRQRC